MRSEYEARAAFLLAILFNTFKRFHRFVGLEEN
jgi:hypothetical protein